MKKRFLLAALGLAAAVFVFGESSAKADHQRSGFGTGYGGYGYGGYRGGIGISPIYPDYGFDRGYRRGFHRGQDRCRPPVPPPCSRRGDYRGFGNNINLLTPNLQLGIRY